MSYRYIGQHFGVILRLIRIAESCYPPPVWTINLKLTQHPHAYKYFKDTGYHYWGALPDLSTEEKKRIHKKEIGVDMGYSTKAVQQVICFIFRLISRPLIMTKVLSYG